jgi:patatin-related protein
MARAPGQTSEREFDSVLPTVPADAIELDRAPPFVPTQEVRFALVLYGGVSLAIYINGVVQELLHLVRATAPAGPTDTNPTTAWKPESELSGSERVYRRLGRMIAWGKPPLAAIPGPDAPILTRFVVDIISGSSAGGINGIYLGKALANEQEIDQLKRLWIEEGDIGKLVNDKPSYDGLALSHQRPPQSVLNSRRMYWKLLEALDGMDRSPAAETSRFVDELDLWITTTDLRGLLLPIDLFDRVVYEKRHKNVFHFRYGTAYARGGNETTNDFPKENNPFLAFAGRCTSAFPFAFEPMELVDINEVLRADAFRDYARERSASPRWRRFFDDYVRARRRPEDPEGGDERYYETDAFADGGYLDNKPFTWATQDITRRRADLPVDRRLIYVEPDPGGPLARVRPAPGTRAAEEPEPAVWSSTPTRPDPIENVQAAALTLPRAETIRDDLEQVIKRNRQIGRIRDIVGVVDRTADDFPQLTIITPPLDIWRSQPLSEVLASRVGGLPYVAYHRLKVAGVLDDLALMVTRVSGFSDESDEFAAIRCLIQAWAEQRYPEEPEQPGQLTQNEFLLRFDLSYRLRRLNFLNERIERLLLFDARAQQVFQRFVEINPRAFAEVQGQIESQLRAKKTALNGIFVRLRAEARALRSAAPSNPLGEIVAGFELEVRDLLDLLDGATTKEESVARGRDLINRRGLYPKITEASEELNERLLLIFGEASRQATELLELARPRRDDLPPAQHELPYEVALRPLRYFYNRYESYDAVAFPFGYGIADEADRVEIIRISPQDAPSLIDEAEPGGRKKLAGVEINHFGGFFEQAWRRNDLMWGRLDAAERIIDTLLLPGSVPTALREQLLKDVQLAIIAEEFSTDDRAPLTALMTKALLETTAAGDEQTQHEAIDRLLAREQPQVIQGAVGSTLDPETIWNYLRTDYEVDRALDRERLLNTVGRATQVTGRLLDGVSDRYRLLRKPSRWLVRGGQLIWGMVEVSTPRTFGQIFFRYWLPVLMLMALLLIVGGALFGAPATAKAGWVLLLILLGWRLAVWMTQDVIRRRHGWAIGFAVGAVCVGIGLAVAEAVLHLSGDLADVLAKLPNFIENAVRWLWPWDHPTS